MKLAFVVPKTDISEIAPPMNLAVMAAFIRKNKPTISVRIFDGAVDPTAYSKLEDFKPDIIGVTATTPQIYEAYALIDRMKNRFPEVFTIIGGVHCSALPEEAAKHADCVVTGEGEIALLQILNDLEAKSTVPKIVAGQEIEDLDSLPFPALDLLDMQRYLYQKISYIPTLNQFPLIRLMSSRGCNYRCPFCYNSRRKTAVRYHSAKYLIELVEFIRKEYGIRSIWFHDDEFVSNKERLFEFLNEYKSRGLNQEIKWACQARVTSINNGVALKLKEAGCNLVFLGIESASRSLGFLKCGTVQLSDIEAALQACHRAKLAVFGNFIFGSINEPLTEMEKTWKWISNHRNKGLTYFGFGILAPFPGSSLYEYALKNEIFMQSNVDYNRIASSRDVNSIYLLDTAVSKKELHSFITKGVQLLWVEEQINTRNLRGILTPTFLKVSLNQPKAIIGILSK
jgi:radical SAM superfamily enzyme YgiQ (UPF0313 family)